MWRLYYLNPASVKAVVTIAYKDVHPRSFGFFSCITALKNKYRKTIFPELPSLDLFRLIMLATKTKMCRMKRGQNK